MRTATFPTSIVTETLERRYMMSAATDATGFYPAVQLSGETPVTLYPVESVAAGQSVKVSFGVPFPRGFVPLGDLTKVKVLDAGGAERALSVQLLTPWRDLMNLVDENSARSALVQLNVAFPDADGDGDADPVQLRLAWGGANRSPADLAPVDPRTTWVAANDASYPASAGVSEPNAYAAFSPDWYGQSLLKTRTQAMGSDGDFAAYEGAFENFARTAVNDVDPRVTAGNRINYLTGDGEPWLYDRSTALYQLAFRTGEFRWLREAHRSSQFYANNVNARGYFAPQDDDMKYSYGESIAIDYWLTGDARLLDVHRRVITPYDRDFTAAYTPGRIWTERSASGKMLAYVTGYELLGEVAQGQKAKDVFNVYLNHQANPPAGAANTGLLMHRSEDHIEGGQEWVASPWMTSLLVDTALRYYVHSGDVRVEQFVTRIADGMNRLGESIYYHDYQGRSYLASFYLAGPGLTEDQHQADFFADKEHAIDVSRVFALAYYFSRKAGAPNAAYLGRFNEMMETATFNFGYWTRPAGPESGLTVYRVTPPRKFNWWFKNTADIDFLVGADAPSSPDLTDPTLTLNAPNLTSGGGATYQFTVTYFDNRSINISTIDSNDLAIRGPGGSNLVATLVSVNSSTNGTPRTATYSVAAPGGTWDPADDGSYQVDMRANQVADTAGRFVAANFLGRFTVATAGAPMITNVSSGNVTTTGVTITWTTNEPATTQIEYGTTNGYGQTTTLNTSMVTSHSATISGLAPSTVYHFRVLSRNAAGTTGASSDFTFTTNGQGGPGDTTAPTAAANIGPVLSGADYTFTVTYSDNSSLNIPSIDGNDVLVTGPNGFSQLASLVSVVNAGGASRRATYRITAPGGAWDAADAGQYVVALQAGQVMDGAANAVAAGQLGTFDFSIADGRTLLGAFGLVNGRTTSLKFADPDGTGVIASLKGGGTAQAFLEDGRVVLELTGTAPTSTLSLKGKGGDARISLGGVHVAGPLKGLKATTADLFGTLFVAGPAGAISLGTINGGTVAVAGSVLGVTVKGGVLNGRILAGVNLGADRELGGGDDTAAAAVLRKVAIGATATGSIFAAGVLPGANGTYGDNDDVGTGAASSILSFSSRGDVDATSRFEAGTFGRAKIGRMRADPSTDPRFMLLA